jgi:PhzF family phenazine biosynthesis protein
MAQPFVQVDAFTDRPFAGNPAAVVLLERQREDPWMAAVAREMNLSETAFLERRGEEFGLRWFTPAVEVDLCGHATLASAHVLWEEGVLPSGASAKFRTRSGLLAAERRGDEIEMDFPADPPQPIAPPAGLAQALGIEPAPAAPAFVGKGRFDHLVVLDSEKAVRGVKPDFARLREISSRGVIVSARSQSPDFDFVSRFFAPAAGVDEDPVTGSAHCTLAVYWGERLGKREMVGFQASARGGVVRVRLASERVKLGGRAVTVLRGEILM